MKKILKLALFIGVYLALACSCSYAVAPTLKPSDEWYQAPITDKSTITKITFTEDYTVTGDEESWNAGTDENDPIMCYITGTELTVVGNGSGSIMANADSSHLFSDSDVNNVFLSLQQIDNLSLIDTSNVTNMNNMFYDCRELTNLDLSNFDTSQVTDMGNMFFGCSKLESIDMSGFDTSSVTNMQQMFAACGSLTSLSVSGFDTSNVIYMRGMFANCLALTSIDVSNFNTAEVTTMAYLFSGCSSLTSIDVSAFNTNKVIDMDNIFSGCSNLTRLDLSSFNTSNVVIMDSMFDYMASLEEITLGDNFTFTEDFYFITPGMDGADGFWYTTDGGKYTAEQVVSNHSSLTTYYAILPTSQNKVCSCCDSEFIGEGTRCYECTGQGSCDFCGVCLVHCECGSAVNYRVTYDANGGDGAPRFQMKAEGEYIVISDVIPIRDGYQFLGWALTSTATVPEYVVGDILDDDADITLYAVWQLVEVPTLISSSTWYKSATAKSTITEINIVDTYTETGSESETWNADVDNTGSIKCYLEGTILTIAGNGSGSIMANADSSYLFSDSDENNCFLSLQQINNLSLIDTTNVTNMKNMFYLCTELTSLDLSNFNTSQVTDMSVMFMRCEKLQELDLSNFDTSQVTNMKQMFRSCKLLIELDLSNFNTSNVINMKWMFDGDIKIKNLDLSNFNTSQVTDMSWMFYDCKELANLDVSNFNTSQVTDMSSMFRNCESLTELDLSSFGTSQVTTMSDMFSGVISLNEFTLGTNFIFTNDCTLPHSNNNGVWYTADGTSYSIDEIKANHTSLTTYYAMQPTSLIYTIIYDANGGAGAPVSQSKSQEVDLTLSYDIPIRDGYEFLGWALISTAAEPKYQAGDTFNIDADTILYAVWELKQVPTLLKGTEWYKGVTEKDLITKISIVDSYTQTGNETENWRADAEDTGSIICYVDGTTLIIAGNETESIKLNSDSRSLFTGFTKVVEINGLDMLDTREVTDMAYMFNQCYELTSLDITKFNTTNVTYMSYMFYGCNLSSLDLRNFDTANVTSMYSMFSGCGNLANLNLTSFNTSNVTNMGYMFSGCSSLQELDLSILSTEKASNMTNMFEGMIKLSTVTIGGDFRFCGANSLAQCELPQPSSQYIDGANGKWYKADGTERTSGQIASLNSRGTFYAVDPSMKITVTDTEGGSITPNGTVSVAIGATQTFSIVPNEGYHIRELLIDGVSNVVSNITYMDYSFDSISSNHTISATYEQCTGGTATCSAKATCVTCGRQYGELLAHTMIYQSDETNHWQECSVCGAEGEIETHIGGTATCEEQALCTTCNRQYGELLAHTMIYQSGETNHWQECSMCGAEGERENHMGGTATCEEQATCAVCNREYGTLLEHTMIYQSGEANHWQECSMCGAEGERENHMGGIATCEEQATCAVCNIKYGDFAEHNWEMIQSENCTEACLEGCTVCREEKTVGEALGHNYEIIQEADCTKEEIQECTRCKDKQTTKSALGHKYSYKSDETYHWQVCSICGTVEEKSNHIGGNATSTTKAICEKCSTPYGGFVFTVTFDANGGSGFMSIQTFAEGISQNLKPNSFTRRGYEFIGWATSMDGSVEYADDVTYTLTSDLVLYAVWKPKVPTLLKGTEWYKGTTEKSQITKISIVDSYTGNSTESWRADVEDIGAITCYVNENELIIAGNKTGSIKLNADSRYLFSSFNAITEIVGLNLLDTSDVTNMMYMFLNCSSLTNLDINTFNTSNVIDMGAMFRNCSGLVKLNIDKLNTEKVSSMRYMFAECKSLTDLDISNFDTSNVVDMEGLFCKCRSLKSVILGDLDTTNVVDMSNVFRECPKLTSVDLSSFNTTKVRDLDYMFYGSGFNVLDLSNFDTSATTTMYEMFSLLNNLSEVTLGEMFVFAEDCVFPESCISTSDGKWYTKDGNSYTPEELVSSHTLLTTYYAVDPNIKITVSSSAGGSISPDGIVLVEKGSDKKFTIKPAPGYRIKTVTVDGINIEITNKDLMEYTFNNVSENHTLYAIWELNISGGAGGGSGGGGSGGGGSGGGGSASDKPSEDEEKQPEDTENSKEDEELEREQKDLILIIGKSKDYNEVLLPLNDLLKIYGRSGEIKCTKNKGTYSSKKQTIIFEDGKLNITVNNASDVLARPAKIINKKIYITLTDFLNLM